jgi:hypothetical protein
MNENQCTTKNDGDGGNRRQDIAACHRRQGENMNPMPSAVIALSIAFPRTKGKEGRRRVRAREIVEEEDEGKEQENEMEND